ncbi:SIR2 family protein, partial [Botryobacter ruber]|uniref:SIR2 family protein n=1 Tax=Botryobacter ruber TaxID=2171629 RepID=UPI0013E3090C
MSNHIIDFEGAQLEHLHELFKKIAEGNVILFLGAGASVTDEKKFMSYEVMELYQTKLGRDFGTKDIVEFVDMLQEQRDLSRKDFDNFVDSLLRRLPVTEAHKTLASIPWRQIITTNYDLLVERAFDEVANTSNEKFKLIRVRKKQEYSFHTANNEVKYIKLNGSIEDKKEYPLVFSSNDFKEARKFYK